MVEGRRTGGGGGEEESVAMADASETAKGIATVWPIGTRWQPLTRCPIEKKADQMETIQVTLSLFRGEKGEEISRSRNSCNRRSLDVFTEDDRENLPLNDADRSLSFFLCSAIWHNDPCDFIEISFISAKFARFCYICLPSRAIRFNRRI